LVLVFAFFTFFAIEYKNIFTGCKSFCKPISVESVKKRIERKLR
jgi:hypothetical protein